MNIVKELTKKLNEEGIAVTERTVNKIVTWYVRTKKKALLQGDTVVEEGLLTISPHFRFNSDFVGRVAPNLNFECKMNPDFKNELGKMFCSNPKARESILKDRKLEIESNDSVMQYMANKYGTKIVK